MTLYVSNPSRQQVEFHFRTAITKDTSGPHVVIIPSGAQVDIGHGWTQEQTAYVIKQIMHNGGAQAAEAHGRMGKFTGLLYRENQPVDEDEILTAHDAVMKDANDRSVRQVTNSALAFDRVANKGGGRRGNNRLAKVTGVEISQELEPHQRRTGDEVDFSLTVDPDAPSGGIKVPA